jgi:hypothetical protein
MIFLNFENVGKKRFLLRETFLQNDFEELNNSYPDYFYFGDFNGKNRRNNQRDHIKKFLSFNSKIKDNDFNELYISFKWKEFINYFLSSEYLSFIKNFLEIDNFEVGFEWSIIDSGDDLCPHIDCCKKLGTHLFYFPHTLWEGIGGDFIFLSKSQNNKNPEIVDFKDKIVVKYEKNTSILFKNNKELKNWHSVSRVNSNIPRRVFQIIFWNKNQINCFQV